VCGRFNLTRPKDIEARFGFFDWYEKRIEPRFNIAPSQEILTFVWDPTAPGGDQPRAQFATWGLAPFWAQPGTGNKRPPPINARSETVATSPMFREAFARGRCLIPATGFYEWQRRAGAGGRVPMHIQMKTGALFAFAGLWAPGPRDGLPTATVLTCAPNELMASIHNRMPVILKPEDERAWLAPARGEDLEPYRALLRPYRSDAMTAYAISSLVNSFQNEGPELLAPAKPVQHEQLSMF
jgi:putative SOS response-associated peptidase YedK